MASVVAVQGRGVPQEDFLENRFDLTPAEARLVIHLIQGTSLKSSAQALGVKYETARTCLKSVFQKTGTHRQPQLVLTVFRAIHHNPHAATVPSGGLRAGA
jgi:DNA-binding CsgD family transcriptional regulator